MKLKLVGVATLVALTLVGVGIDDVNETDENVGLPEVTYVSLQNKPTIQEEMIALREASEPVQTIEEVIEVAAEEVEIIEATKIVTMNVTAYTLHPDECGKEEDDPGYGITASGNRVREWRTVAASRSLPFNTRVYIPYFKDAPNEGIFVVEDRGGAIKEGKLDIYMENRSDAFDFGRRNLEVHILP